MRPRAWRLADDLIEIELGSDFVFQVELFLGKLVLQFADLLERERVFNGNGDLDRDLNHQLQIRLREGVNVPAGQRHGGNGALV